MSNLKPREGDWADLDELVSKAVSVVGAEEQKFCNGCKIWQPISNFNSRNDRSSADKNGKVSKCRACTTEASRKYYAANKQRLQEDSRRRQYFYRHGDRLTESEVDKLLESRVGLCEVCLQETELYVDHCHRTGIKRGMLCRNCNFSLGLAGDSIHTLERMIGYLQNYRRREHL